MKQTREQIALAFFSANLQTQMKEANRYIKAEKQRAVFKDGMAASFQLADIWIEVRDKEEGGQP